MDSMMLWSRYRDQIRAELEMATAESDVRILANPDQLNEIACWPVKTNGAGGVFYSMDWEQRDRMKGRSVAAGCIDFDKDRLPIWPKSQ